MRLSAVDGTAIVDFSAAGLLTDHIGKRLTVLDSAGKKLIGFIKAAGTGETYGANLITNGDMELDASWPNYQTPTTNERSSVQKHGGDYSRHIVGDAANDGTAQFGLSVTTGKLYVYDFWGYVVSGILAIQRDQTSLNILPATITTLGSWVQRTGYQVATNTTAAWILKAICVEGAGEFYIDDILVKQVLTPAATGVTIVSTPGGAVFNWESKEAGFNYNDPAGYEYLITNQRAIFTNHYRQMRAA